MSPSVRYNQSVSKWSGSVWYSFGFVSHIVADGGVHERDYQVSAELQKKLPIAPS
jgi:hypothetical protein